MSAELENATLKIVRDMRDAVTAGLLEMQGTAELMNDRMNAGFSGVNTRIDALAKGVAGALNELRGDTNRRFDGLTAAVDNTNRRVDGLTAAVDNTNRRVDGLAAAVDNTNRRVDGLAAAVDNTNTSITSLRSEVQLYHSELDNRLTGLERDLRKSGSEPNCPTT